MVNMARLYASGSWVFASASEALDKYLKDFETSTGVDLLRRSHGDWAAIPKPPPLPDDPTTSLVERIGASSETAMVPYLVQKMAQRAVSAGDLSDEEESESDEEETQDSFSREGECSGKGFVCLPQPITTYPASSSMPAVANTYANLYGDLRRLKEHITNRYWSSSPDDQLSKAAELVRELRAINSGQASSRASADDFSRLSADEERVSPVGSTSAVSGMDILPSFVSSHDSGMNSPPLPPSGPCCPPEWTVATDDGRQRRRDLAASTTSLASSTSRISEPKILSLSEKERIRTRLCELDSMPLALLSPAFR